MPGWRDVFMVRTPVQLWGETHCDGSWEEEGDVWMEQTNWLVDLE